MAQKAIFNYSFNLAAAGTTTQNFDPIDVSAHDELFCVLKLTATDTDASDTLDVYIQSSRDGIVWDDRVHFAQVLGTLSASSVAPEALTATLQQFGTLSDAEEQSEPSGSAGGTSLTAGAVKNGAFPRPLRRGTVTGTGLASTQLQGPSWRARFVVVDGGSANASFVGSLSVSGN